MTKWLFVLLIFMILTTACITSSSDRVVRDPGCIYIYKTTHDYFDYIQATVWDKLGVNGTTERIFNGWPHGLSDVKLNEGYVLGGGGCTPFNNDVRHKMKLVVINLTKVDVNNSFGYPGCTELQTRTYPECFGTQAPVKIDNENCTDIFENERNSDTSICPSVRHPTLDDIVDENPFSEFYVCRKHLNELEANDLIGSERLSIECDKVI